MFVVVPIRTESVARRAPLVNYALIAMHVGAFLLLNEGVWGLRLWEFKQEYLYFRSQDPAFYRFFTYQFLHADTWHLLGNMIFLWVFGNGVNGKMGDLPYLLFYLAGGVFAAWGYALVQSATFTLLGASGAIAAITTAYLALFPRSRVTVLVWFFLFIHFVEVQAMIIIGLKIIVWDNVIAPGLGGSEGVAHGAHLFGYLFGFIAALAMLLLRGLPRDQFDILALWKRWHQRREFAAAMSDPAAAAQARFGSVARTVAVDPEQQRAEARRVDEIADLRARVGELILKTDLTAACALHDRLMDKDPRQCLSERDQLAVAREYYRTGRFQPAAAAFDRFAECYPRSTEASEVRLLVGIIYARDLRQFEAADEHLTRSLETLRDASRREQCLEWLRSVRLALGRPLPDAS
jgi:membrane associated rhomboid family serine protease